MICARIPYAMTTLTYDVVPKITRLAASRAGEAGSRPARALHRKSMTTRMMICINARRARATAFPYHPYNMYKEGGLSEPRARLVNMMQMMTNVRVADPG